MSATPKHNLSIDLETFSSVDIKKAGAFRYVQSPDFEILLFSYSLDYSEPVCIDFAEGDILPPWLADALVNPDYMKKAYNAMFEWACLSKYIGRQLPPEQWRCTMFKGLYAGYTAGLEATGRALGLSEDKRKLNTGKALIRYFCVPCKPTKANGCRTRNLPHHDPQRWELFKEYNRQDVAAEMEIDEKLSAVVIPDFVQKEWETDLKINARGVAVDMEMVNGALEIGADVKQSLTKEAINISGLTNPNSVSQLAAWIEAETEEEITDLRKDTVSKMLSREDNSPEVQRMLEIRRELGKTSTKKYDAIRTCVCDDGRVRGLLQFYGANRTGRWAGRLVQVQNLPRTYTEPLELARELVKGRKTNALRLIYGSVSDTLSQLIRTAFIAPSGRMLVDADFSAIEARVISWLAGEEWRLNVFRTHGKIYEASASQMFGVPLERIKKGNPEYALRQKGKVAELALGYQGSSGALIQMGALDMGIPESELTDIVSRWREANKRIVDLWYKMDSAAVQVITQGGSVGVNGVVLAHEYNYALNTDYMTITLPSGRKLYYISPQIGKNRWESIKKGTCMKMIQLIHDNFQNFKLYNIKRAQLVIADIPYNLGVKAYGSSPEWYNGGDNKNGESKKAKSTFFNGDGQFKIAEYFHFCNKLLIKEPKEKGKAPAMIVFCAFEQIPTVIEYGEQYGFKKHYPLIFCKNYSAQVLKSNMKIVGATEYAIVLYRDKLPKFNNGRQIDDNGKPIRGTGKMIFNWLEWKRDNSKEYPKIHPTQKPVNLLKQLIEIFTDEGDTVIGPVCGSGSTLRACAELNRNCYGFETSTKFYRAAKEIMLKEYLTNTKETETNGKMCMAGS